MTTRRDTWTVTGLLLLSAIPIAAGAFRLETLATGAPAGVDDARFFAAPIPVVTHIVTATLFCVLGAFQFHAGLRARRRRWHRSAGRVVLPAGVLAALSGIWMALTYPLVQGDGYLLVGIRVVFGTAMATSLLLGLRAVLRRDFAVHRRWMLRGYALGVAAGTQSLLLLPIALTVGPPVGVPGALAMAAAWLLNLAVAEWIAVHPPQVARRVPARVGAR